MKDRECVPFAPVLIESMRSLGYSFPAAIADLIDNSISARAGNVWISTEPDVNPYLIILDDGTGMSKDRLYEAMRYGSSNPLQKREKGDLGRFGLGMKAASLSQCRKLVVVSKQHMKICSYAWDIDYVIKQSSWKVIEYQGSEIDVFPEIEKLKALEHGTYIYLSDFDRIKGSTDDFAETFNKNLNDMVNHLSLVFHRFISDGLKIYMNNVLIEGKDPFLSDNKATQIMRESSFYINNEKITLKPYILPHPSKLSQKDLDKVGGKERLKNEQGFYIYRNKRLIVWGTWFRLERKDELKKLARVRVDIPNSLDYMWSIDIKKSSATLPDIIKQNMYSVVYESVMCSERVHTFRGRKNKEGIEFIWEKIKAGDGYEYVINRDIPQLKLLIETLNDQQTKMLSSVIRTLEESFPVNALYVDVAKGQIEEAKDNRQDEIEDIWNSFMEQIEYVKSNNLSVLEYCKAFMNVEPFCNYDEIKTRIQEVIDSNE